MRPIPHFTTLDLKIRSSLRPGEKNWNLVIAFSLISVVSLSWLPFFSFFKISTELKTTRSPIHSGIHQPHIYFSGKESQIRVH